MSKFIDLTGKKFGRLTVIHREENKIRPSGQSATTWLCRCDCGNTIIVTGCDLKKGNTKSCGCLQNEINSSVHKKYNNYIVRDNYIEMYTTKGEKFFVDTEDFEKIKDICWFKDKHGYLVGYKDKEYLTLHRLIMGCLDDNMVVDHIGGSNTIHDNRKENLRIATRSQNCMNRMLASNNTSGVTGVSWDSQMQKWRVQIGIENQRKHLGLFDDFEKAIKIRKEAEEKYFGEYSYDNSQSSVALTSKEKNL